MRLGIKTESTELEPLKYRTMIFRCTDLGSHNKLHLSFYLSKLGRPCNLESLLPSVKCELMRPDWVLTSVEGVRFRGFERWGRGQGSALSTCEGFPNERPGLEGYLWRRPWLHINHIKWHHPGGVYTCSPHSRRKPCAAGPPLFCGQTALSAVLLSAQHSAALSHIKKKKAPGMLKHNFRRTLYTSSNSLSFPTHLGVSFLLQMADSLLSDRIKESITCMLKY